MIDRASFEQLVADALDELPEPFASHLDNVHIVVADEPDPDDLADADLEPGGTLFGLYVGIPQTERDAGYTFVMPDVITIFRRPLLEVFDDEAELVHQVRVTVVHELAHHFGIDDARLEELGWD